LDEQNIKDKDCSWNIVGLNIEFLLVLNHDDVTWDYSKGGDLGERISFLDTNLGSKNSCRYLVTENHKFYFDIPELFFCCFDIISTKHGISLSF
jgi:hypothetical protein